MTYTAPCAVPWSCTAPLHRVLDVSERTVSGVGLNLHGAAQVSGVALIALFKEKKEKPRS